MEKSFITQKQRLSLELDIYTLLMESENMDMAEMGACVEAAKSLVDKWKESNNIEYLEEPFIEEIKVVKTAWVLMSSTFCDGEVIGCWIVDEKGNDIPCTFESEEDAKKEIADDMITVLQQFIDGEREMDDTDFNPTNYPLEVDICEDGFFYDQIGRILFEPKIGRP